MYMYIYIYIFVCKLFITVTLCALYNTSILEMFMSVLLSMKFNNIVGVIIVVD